jgi:hypothetical protein
MKKIALVLLAMVLVSSIAISGDMAKSGQWGINTSLSIATPSSGLSVNAAGFKFMATDNVAVRASVGFTSFNSGGTNSTTTSGYSFAAGFEYHMTAIGGVSPYLGLQAGYGGASLPNLASGYSNPNVFTVAGVYGGEYFFSSNFSLAGEVGIGFSSSNSGYPNASAQTTFGTVGVAGLVATWYLN